MFKVTPLLILFAIGQGVYAEDTRPMPTAEATPEVYVWTTANPQTMKEKFYKDKRYRMIDSVEEDQQFDEEGYVLPRKRNAIFHKLNLEGSVADMREMDKDMMVMDARFMPSKQFKILYPKISDQQLSGLRRELGLK